MFPFTCIFPPACAVFAAWSGRFPLCNCRVTSPLSILQKFKNLPVYRSEVLQIPVIPLSKPIKIVSCHTVWNASRSYKYLSSLFQNQSKSSHFTQFGTLRVLQIPIIPLPETNKNCLVSHCLERSAVLQNTCHLSSENLSKPSRITLPIFVCPSNKYIVFICFFCFYLFL